MIILACSSPSRRKRKQLCYIIYVIGSNKFNAHLVEKGLYLVEIN